MSNELHTGAATGNTVYAQIFSPSARRWNGSSFEVYSSANYDNYDIPLTEQGSSGVYVGDFPTAITDPALYEIYYYIQNGGAPTEGDPIAGIGSVNWDGSTVIPSSATVQGEMSATDFYDYVIRTFKRTDKSLEFYDSVNEAIAEIRRNIATSREEKETSVTDAIATLGDYRMDVEDDFGMNVSGVFVRDESNGRDLIPISKSKFDALYSWRGTGTSQRASPKHYCLFGGQILVGPVPDSVNYTYVVSYSKDDHVLVDSTTDSVPFTTTDYREIMKHGVLARLFSGINNDAQAQKYQAFWMKGLLEIELKETRNKSEVIIMQYNDF